MEIGVKLEKIYCDRDVIEVLASVWNGAFGGKAKLYVGFSRLEEVAANLRGFPAHLQDRREVTMGTFNPRYAGGGLRMQFYCVDRSGHAIAQVQVESQPCVPERNQSVRLQLPIQPAAVDSFVGMLERLGSEGTEFAWLEGSP